MLFLSLPTLLLTHIHSVNSIDDMLDAQEPQETSDTWDQELRDRIEEIIDRKRSSEEGRERTLMAYNHYLMVKYCYDEIENKIAELYPALCKSIKTETGEKEACLALRGMRHHHYAPCELYLIFSLSQLSVLQLLHALPKMFTKVYFDLSSKPTKDQNMLLSKRQLFGQ
jgi:hypothetical protein